MAGVKGLSGVWTRLDVALKKFDTLVGLPTTPIMMDGFENTQTKSLEKHRQVKIFRLQRKNFYRSTPKI